MGMLWVDLFTISNTAWVTSGNGLPNMIAIFALSVVVVKETRLFFNKEVKPDNKDSKEDINDNETDNSFIA